MNNYFYDMVSAEELQQLPYIPTFPEFVEWIEEKYADLTAVNDLQVKYTYKEFCDRIARRRAFIYSLGLEKGANIAIFDRNSIDAVELFLAITSAGYVAINLPNQLPAPAVVGCSLRFQLGAMFVRDEFKPLTEGVKCKVCSTKDIADAPAPVAKVDKDDPAAIFFTGGTTGAPKGAILPHRALLRGALNGCYAPGKQIGCNRYIGLLPLSHVFGLIRSTLSAFYSGAEWYAAEDMKATIGKLPVIKPTILVLVPGLCEILAGLSKMYGPQFLGGELKYIISGAANVPPRLMSVFEQLGTQLFAGYGMTEGANLTTGNIDVKTKPTSVGKFYPGQEYKVVDGELWYKGDNVFLGYYNDPVNTEATLTPDGWIKTGDLVKFDDEGYMYIVGRIKNLIILPNGENVSPESIEEPFYKYATVRDCLVSQKDFDGEECIFLDILPNMPALEGKSEEEIAEYFKNLVAEVNATLPTTHRVAKWNVRKEDFKRTGSLKVARNQ